MHKPLSVALLVISMAASASAFAMEGYDRDTRYEIEVAQDVSLKTGKIIKIHDLGTDSFHDVVVMRIRDSDYATYNGHGEANVDVYDYAIDRSRRLRLRE